MKKLLLASILSIVTIAVSATNFIEKKDDAKKISYTVKKDFEESFKDASEVSWTLTGEFQKVKFTLGGKRHTAIYDLDGNYLGATQYVSYSELPASALKEIEKTYKDYNFTEALKVVDRPADYNGNDVGTYWIDLGKNGQQVYLNFSETTGLVVFKNIESLKNAKN